MAFVTERQIDWVLLSGAAVLAAGLVVPGLLMALPLLMVAWLGLWGVWFLLSSSLVAEPLPEGEGPMREP